MCFSSRTSIISANFQRLPTVLKKFSPLGGDNAHLTKSILTKSPSRRISSFQQGIKLDQFSQQNTHYRTAILQNCSLGAPIITYYYIHCCFAVQFCLFQVSDMTGNKCNKDSFIQVYN